MHDFYVGFEGEPEIRFVLKLGDAPERVLRVWEGHFDRIMAKVQPVNGQWTGLALPYHLHDCWYDGAPWKLKDLDYVADQWKAIDTSGLPPRCLEVHSAVLGLLIECIDGGGDLWISYE